MTPITRKTRAIALLFAVLLFSLVLLALARQHSRSGDLSPVGLSQMGKPGGALETALGGFALALQGANRPPPPPPRPAVAVLNATKVPGMAAGSAAPLKQASFRVSPVSNYDVVVLRSRVEFEQGHRGQAEDVAEVLSLPVMPMIGRTVAPAGGSHVAVVIGNDRTCPPPAKRSCPH